MTFHVLYNDCHLEADMERERERKRRSNRGTSEERWRERQKEGGKRAAISGGKMAEVTSGCDQTAPN